MTKKMKTNYDEWREKKFQDPKFRKLYAIEAMKFSIAEKIRNRREFLKMTQQELAKRAKTSQSAIARIENTDYDGYSVTKLEEIAEALNASLIIDFIPKKSKKGYAYA